MNRLLSIWVLCLFVMGCPVGGDYHLRSSFPATIFVKNVSSESFTIKSIYSISDTEAAFILKGGKLSPGEELSLMVSESSYNIFVNKEYMIDVKCPSKEVQSLNGEAIDAVQLEKSWAMELSLNPCK